MLKQRVITALLLVPSLLAAVFGLPASGFALLAGVIVMLGAWEWANLAGHEQPVVRVAYALVISGLCWLAWITPSNGLFIVAAVWWLLALLLVSHYPRSAGYINSALLKLVIGVFTLVPAWAALVMMKRHSVALHGALAITVLLLLVWSADIGAYFAGRCYGRHALAPYVSPKKTWEGLAGGLFSAMVTALAVAIALGWGTAKTTGFMVIAIIIVLLAVLGDLLESLLKRERGIKDSGRLLPGHGGVLDRIDSLTAAAPLFALAFTVAGI